MSKLSISANESFYSLKYQARPCEIEETPDVANSILKGFACLTYPRLSNAR